MYVQRNDDGVICGLYANLQPGFAEEFLPADSSEVIEFYARVNGGGAV